MMVKQFYAETLEKITGNIMLVLCEILLINIYIKCIKNFRKLFE